MGFLSDDAWNDEAGLEFLLEISGPRVGRGQREHDRVCELAASRLYRVLRAEGVDSERLVRILQLGRSGSAALGNLELLAWPTLEAANLLAGDGKLPEALEHIEETCELLPAEHSHQLPLKRRVALLSSNHGRFREALDILDGVDRMIDGGLGEAYARHINQRDRAAVLLRMGLIDLAVRELEGARAGLEKAYADRLPVKGPLVNAYCTLVHIYLTQGRFGEVIDESEHLLGEYAELFEERAGGRATMLFNRGLAHELSSYEDPSHSAAATESFRRVLAIPQASGEERDRSQIALARLEIRAGKPKLALERLAKSQLDGLPTMLKAETLAAAARAGIVAEESVERLSERRRSLGPALDAVYDDIAAQPPRAGGVGLMGYRIYRMALATLVDLHLAIDGDAGTERVLESLFRAQGLHSLARLSGADRFAATQVQQDLVPPEGGILVFFPAEDACHLLAIDSERILHSHTGGILGIRELSAPFTDRLRRSPTDLSPSQRKERATRLETQARKLFETLIPKDIRPVLAEWDSLLFVGSDYLRGLPIESLIDSSGASLGLTKSIAHLPSLPLGLHLLELAKARANVAPSNDLFLVGDAVSNGRPKSGYGAKAAFRMSATEREHLRAPFPRSRVRELLGEDATLARLEALKASETRLMHLVTHGVRDDARETSRGLLLTPTQHHDGSLFDRDVVNLPRADLVILSSCASGQGPWRGGDDKSATLIGAFLREGATSVLAATSAMELTPTLELTSAFQAEIAAGRLPANALLQARNRLVKAGFDDPYYYGLMQITGTGHTPLFPRPHAGKPFGQLALGLAAALVAGLLARWWYRRTRADEFTGPG